jgi:CheY-like chemotaxis protein
VAHDFNNVLTAVLGYNDKLLRGLGPTDPRRYEAEEVRRAALRGVGLTQQLLAFSRSQVLEPQVLDLREVLSEMRGVLQMLIGEGIRLSVEPATTLPKVRVDRTQLEQVVLNLAINARDAMDSGGVLRISTADVELDRAFEETHPGSRRGHYARLSVEDNGCGMDAAIQARIFEPFFTTKPRDKGTGLGLATVYGIVKQSQGYIDVDSAPGRGTIFHIYLPASSECAESRPRATDLSSAPQPVETVLLVEDDAQVRALAKRILEEHGYHVLEAADGLSALDLLERHSGRIHGLVTDVVMPGINGPELVRRVAERLPGLPVLYISGYTEPDLVKASGSDAPVSFLAKPFEASVLIERLKELIGGVGAI